MSSLRAEADGAGRAGLHAGRLEAHADAVGAQRALVGLVVLLADARDVERAAGDAVAAADAVLRDEVDDAVGVLDDRARRRAGLEAARVVAVHAAVLADQPLEVAVLGFDLEEAHHGPRVGRQVARVVVARRRWCRPRRAGRSTPCTRPGRPCSRCTWTRRSAWRPAASARDLRAWAWWWPSAAATSSDCMLPWRLLTPSRC